MERSEQFQKYFENKFNRILGMGEGCIAEGGREEVLRINPDFLKTEGGPHLMEENNEFLSSALDMWELRHFRASVFNSNKSLKVA